MPRHCVGGLILCRLGLLKTTKTLSPTTFQMDTPKTKTGR